MQDEWTIGYAAGTIIGQHRSGRTIDVAITVNGTPIGHGGPWPPASLPLETWRDIATIVELAARQSAIVQEQETASD